MICKIAQTVQAVIWDDENKFNIMPSDRIKHIRCAVYEIYMTFEIICRPSNVEMLLYTEHPAELFF